MKGRSYNQHAFTATGKVFRHYQIFEDEIVGKIYNSSSESLLDIFAYKSFKEAIK